MENGIGGMDQQQALEALEDLNLRIQPIPLVEYESRIERAQSLMVEKGLHALYLNAGTLCGAVDAAAREVLESHGFGPDYALPGLPHRTGHGIGLDIHEWPYLVRGDKTPLAPGMCFSNEPMLCVPGEFGVRLEDHFYMTEDGPRWFTQPSQSIDNPFNYEGQSICS